VFNSQKNLVFYSDISLVAAFFSIIDFLYLFSKVHIPCPHDKQWILVVANFMDLSFDVLNPDHSHDKFERIVNTVIFNFKNLFVKSYPGCLKFNIWEFTVRHIHVPKFNFRLAI
jgi:hypothetical protein